MSKKKLSLEDLEHVLQSDDFKKDLEEMSSYAARTKQERPILCLLAKHLCRKGFAVELEGEQGEQKRIDLKVGNIAIEAKIYCEFDLGEQGEISKKFAKKKSTKMYPSISKDIFNKEPDIFILIILSRDLSKVKVTKKDLNRKIAYGFRELKYGGYNCKDSFEILDGVLDRLNKKKNFILKCVKLETNPRFPSYPNPLFPSTYHFYFLHFNKSRKST